MTGAPLGLFVGLTTVDVVQLVDRMPRPNEKSTAQRTWLAAGGPAAVAAIAFAALGGRARLWSALGAGVTGTLARADLERAGVEVIDAAPSDYELAVSTALVNPRTGDRAVVSGSAHEPSLGVVTPPGVEGVDVVLIDGHLPTRAEAVVPMLGPATPLVVDAGSHKPVFDAVLPRATDIVFSADYRHPAGLVAPDFLGGGVRLAAVSHGPEPLEWWTPTGSGRLAPGRVEARDTLGAGDVLHGTYAFFLASGVERVEALRRAMRAATTRVGLLGPFQWRDTLRQGGL